jgi:hypothetical protein
MAGISSVQVPYYLQAQNLVYLIGQGGVPNNTTGLFNWSTAKDIGSRTGDGTFEAIEWDIDNTLENFRAADAIMKVMMKEEIDFLIGVNAVSSSAYAGVLAELAMNFDVVRIEALYRPKGATTGGTIVLFAGTIQKLRGGIRSGKNITTMPVVPIGEYPYIGPATTTLPF